METATIWIETDSTLKSNVRREGVTPAEASILRKMFGKKIKGEPKPTNPFTHLDITDKADKRKDVDEYQRLVMRYGDKVISDAFPGENPKFPQTFADVGLEESKEAEPDSGKKQIIIPIEKLERGLEDGEKDAAFKQQEAMMAMIKQQGEQIAMLTQIVGRLTGASSAQPSIQPPKANA